MSCPQLKRGSKGKDVQHLQHNLNRVGAMLVTDGDFGSGTERGIRYAQDVANLAVTGNLDERLWSWLEVQSDPYPPLDTDGVAFIAREETGGLAYYDALTRWPHYPGLSSGITIGVGYDLRFNTEKDFRKNWGSYLAPDILEELVRDIGKPGTKKRSQELKKRGIQVPFKAAWKVFINKTLPRFHEDTRSIYPSLDTLPLLCRCALVSIVFNRGNSLEGSRRSEMRTIRDILIKASNPVLESSERKRILRDVEDEIVAMQRLWGPETGLYKRRQGEANLWRTGLETL